VLDSWRRLCLLDLGGQGGQIGVEGFLQQALLFGVVRLGLRCELQRLSTPISWVSLSIKACLEAIS
jgi:hypothetical protein